MTRTSDLQITTPSDTEIEISRSFAAPRHLVFDAFTKPELIKRWLLGPPGWTMPVCEVDLRVGGQYRYVWRHEVSKQEMGLGGEYREIDAPAHLVATEQFEQPWYPGIGVGTFRFVEKNGRTFVTQTMMYESKEIRDQVAKSGMDSGVGASYDRLADILES